MRNLGTRLVSTLLLAIWMAPGAGALAVGLHLALDHHGPHGNAEHTLEISELVQTASHGHRHEDATTAAPDHDHEATADGSGPSLRPSTAWIAVLESVSPKAGLSGYATVSGSLRRGPPLPLFTAHCALLL